VLLSLEIATARRDIASFFEDVHEGGHEVPLLAHEVEWNRQSKCSATIITSADPQQVCLLRKLRRTRKPTTKSPQQNKRHCGNPSSASTRPKELPDWVHNDDDFSDGEIADADVGPTIANVDTKLAPDYRIISFGIAPLSVWFLGYMPSPCCHKVCMLSLVRLHLSVST
jgi:hypothetical protein